MLKLKKYILSNCSDSPCYHCDLFRLCSKCLNEEGRIKQEVLDQMKQPSILFTDKEQIMDQLSYAIRCKKQYPNYYVKNERIRQHVLVDRGGNELLRANSFGGLIGGMFGATFLAIIAFIIIALIFCGIGNLLG